MAVPMVVCFFARRVDTQRKQILKKWYNRFTANNIRVYLEKSLSEALDIKTNFVFESYHDLKSIKPNFFIAFGGDGTLLDSLIYVQDLEIPIVGVNMGKLGYLVLNDPSDPDRVISYLTSGNYAIEKRSVLQIVNGKELSIDPPYALNDFVLYRGEYSATITVEVVLGQERLAIFKADGVIVSTPTGSTAYSLSCGGPILHPQTKTFVITPIAPHNLNLRPVVVPDTETIEVSLINPERAVLSLDTRVYKATTKPYEIKKASFFIYLVRPPESSFISSLREKLFWASDKRF
ncbi:MAG: NAD(+) kinase [Chlorobi bacterium]|nr:NAD(+) kinase [Chlorobiota bacterium]